MKIKTDLAPRQLLQISKGLAQAAKHKHRDYVSDNAAEHKLIQDCNSLFDSVIEDIMVDILATLEE